MTKNRIAALRPGVLMLVSGCLAGTLIARAPWFSRSELTTSEASSAITNLLDHYDGEIHILTIAPRLNFSGIEAYVNNNYQNVGERLFSVFDSGSSVDNCRNLQDFLTKKEIHIQLPAHFFVRKSENDYLIRVDCQSGTWVIRKEHSGGEITLVGLK